MMGNKKQNTDEQMLPVVVDSIQFIANSLGEESNLRQMIDDWCIKQLGNTDEAIEKADKMFTVARDVFYKGS